MHDRAWFARFARAAFAAKGFLYLFVATVALRADLMFPGTGTRMLLAGLFVTLLAAAAYKVVEALAHPDLSTPGSDTVVIRIARLATAVLYVALAGVVLHQFRDPHVHDVHWTARLLEGPFGPEIVTLAGVCAIAFGVHQLYRAEHADCLRSFDRARTTATMRRVAILFGAVAYGGRGIAFGVVGVFLIKAAITFDPRVDARGLVGAFERLSQTTSGAWALGVFAVGMIAYALFCLLMLARYFTPVVDASRLSSPARVR